MDSFNALIRSTKSFLSISENLTEFEFAPMEVSTLLVKLLREILIENGENWARVLPEVKNFLRSVIQAYKNNRFSRDIRTRILILLCDIVLNWKLCKVYGYERSLLL